MCRSTFLSPDDIEQEAWLALSKAAEKWDESRGVLFSTYAFTVVMRNVHRYVSNSLKKETKLMSFEDLDLMENTTPNHEIPIDIADNVDILFSKMLHPEVVQMHIYEGLSCREIGRRIGKSHQSVRNRVISDIERIREYYETIDNR